MVRLSLLSILGLAVIAGIVFFLWQRRDVSVKPAAVPLAAAAEATTSGADNYYVNVASIREIIPTGITMPAKLEKFLQWVSTQPNGSIGYVEFSGSRLTDYWIENGSTLAPKYILFAHLGDGTDIGYWLYDGRTIENAPIVLIGSEGELDILANSLEEFLAGLINDSYSGRSELTAAKDEDDADWIDRRGELSAFLKTAFGFTVDKNVDYQKATQGKQPNLHPDFKKWMTDWGEAQEKISLADPARQAIAAATKTRWSKLENQWDSINIDLFVADDKVSQQLHRSTTQPIAELEKIAPHVLALRHAEMKASPERGAFHFISLRIDQRGHVALMRQDHFKELGNDDVKLTEGTAPSIVADTKKYPRTAYWTPRWMSRLLSNSY